MFYRPDFGKMKYSSMGREINRKSEKKISRNKYFEDINTEKGS